MRFWNVTPAARRTWSGPGCWWERYSAAPAWPKRPARPSSALIPDADVHGHERQSRRPAGGAVDILSVGGGESRQPLRADPRRRRPVRPDGRRGADQGHLLRAHTRPGVRRSPPDGWPGLARSARGWRETSPLPRPHSWSRCSAGSASPRRWGGRWSTRSTLARGTTAAPFNIRQLLSYVWQYYLPRLPFMSRLKVAPGPRRL